MEIISFIVLILLSLVGYSAGAVGKAGKITDLKPRIVDLIIVLLIWTVAIYSRIEFNLNKWLMILIWVILSSIVGIFTTWPKKVSAKKPKHIKKPKEPSSNLFKKLFESWKDFSRRMGSFQSRIILSLFFFIFVSPFALAVKMFSDPLKIKHQSSKSHWLPKKDIETDLEKHRRQF